MAITRISHKEREWSVWKPYPV